MSSLSQCNPSPPSPNSAEAETAALNARIIDTALIESGDAPDVLVKTTASSAGQKESPSSVGLNTYFRVFSYGTAFDYVLIAMCCLTSIGSGISMPLMNVVLGQLVTQFTDYFIPGSNVSKHDFQAAVNKQALYIFILFIAKFILSFLADLTIRISGMRISAALRLAYLRALFQQPIGVIDTISPGKISTRITTSANTVQLALSQHLAMLFQSLALTIGFYVVSFAKGWRLTLVASSCLPFILIAYGIIIPPFLRIHQITEKHHEDASAMAFEIFSSVRIVVAFGAEAKLARKHEAMLEKAVCNARRAAPLVGFMMAPAMVSMFGTIAITFWYGIKQYSQGKIPNLGNIIVVLFSVMMAVMNMQRIASPIIAITKAAAAAAELFVTIDSPLPDTSGMKEPEMTANADITFDKVIFSYPSRPRVRILKGLNLTCAAGKVTAIVGPSGSGKSTIVGLLQRWYDLLGTTAPESGETETTNPSAPNVETSERPKSRKRDWKNSEENKAYDNLTNKLEDVASDLGPNTCTGNVYIGNTDLRHVDLKWWRSQIGLVQQEPYLFNDTLFNNVAFGLCGTRFENLSKDEKMEMVEEACREACAEEFISRLPQGYDTLVGESGIKLSGGQRQRIAIARSIIKRPSILILDEATSAIDVRMERIVQKALDRVSQNRTTIVIAHRLSTIKRADQIVVLRHGELVEQGTHQYLLKNKTGVYYGLVHAQELVMEDQEHEAGSSRLDYVSTDESENTKMHDGKTQGTETKSEYRNKGLFRSFGRLAAEQRHHWILYSACMLGILGAGATYPLQAYFFAKIINIFTLTTQQLVQKGNLWAGMFGVLAAGVGLAYYIQSASSHLISIALTRTFRNEYLSNMIRKPISFFDDEVHSPGSLTSRLSSDCAQIQQLMSTEMAMALIAVVNLIGSTIISFVYGWKLSLVGLCTSMPIILGAGLTRTKLEIKLEGNNAKIFQISSQFATEAVGAFRTVSSLTMESMIGNRYELLLKEHVRQAFKRAKYGTLVVAASDSIELACVAFTFWYGGTLLASHEYGLVDFFVIYMAIIQGSTAAGVWFSFAPSMAQATGAANRILSMRPDPHAPSLSYVPLPSSENGVGISFQNVYFTYKSRDVSVLQNVNMEVLPGQFAALVGASGCGKSTLISLLERFYTVDSGEITYNGQNIKSLDPAEYRKQISLVSQEPTLYEGSIEENITLSVDAASDEEVKQACRDAQIHDFIVSLPEGYATRLGPKGMSLSGGQKQRIALARALLRKPKVLLLDEATSSLDSESEKLVQHAIEKVANAANRTVIAVAHRLATVQKADVIFVLGNGNVLEKGDHQTLLRKRGVYWQMCQAQALDR